MSAIYGVLVLPAALFGLGWPLSRGAPRWTWGVAPLAAAPLLFEAGGGVPELWLTTGSLVTWLVLAVRVGHGARLPRKDWLTFGAVGLGALSWTVLAALAAHPGPG